MFSKKILFLLIVALPVFAANNFLINGDSVATDTIGSQIMMECILEGGDTTLFLTIHVDTDNNGVIDPYDNPLSHDCLIDGSWEDNDESVNGYYSTYTEMVPVSGNFIITATDAGGTDQVILHNLPLNTSNKFEGTVHPDTAGLIVMASDYQMGPLLGDVTQSNGSYSIPMPDSMVGDTFSVMVIDMGEYMPEYLGFASDSLILNGTVIHNDTMIITDYSMLMGYFIYENGMPYDKPLGAMIGGYFVDISGNAQGGIKAGWQDTTTGTEELFLHTSPFGSSLNTWTIMDFLQDADPYTMELDAGQEVSFGSSPDTLVDTFVIYTCDAMIAGTVFVDGNPGDAWALGANNYTTGEKSTGTYSDGYYRFLISSYADSYDVYVVCDDTNYYVEEGVQTVAPGSLGVNFHVISTGIQENLFTGGINIYPNPFYNSVVIEVSGLNNARPLNIHDVTGRKVSSIKPVNSTNGIFTYRWNGKDESGRELPGGIYFIRIKNRDIEKSEKIIYIR